MPALSAYTITMKKREKVRCLNRTLPDFRAHAAGEAATTTYCDLDSFFGSWIADAKVDKTLAEQRKIDRKLWR